MDRPVRVTFRTFTIESVPIQLFIIDFREISKRGRIGRGYMALHDLNLRKTTKFTNDVLRGAVEHFEEVKIKNRGNLELAWFWLVTIVDDISLKRQLHKRAELYRKKFIQEGTGTRTKTALREAEDEVNHLKSYNPAAHTG